MLVFSTRIFEDFLAGTTPVSTAFQQSRALSLADQLAIQVVTWKVSGTGVTSLTLAIEHSTDGRTWISRSGTPEIFAPLSTTATTVLYGWDASATTRLAYTRFTMSLSSTGTSPISGYVRVFATGRDTSKTKPCPCDESYKNTYHRQLPR